jgi:hypothetical protein
MRKFVATLAVLWVVGVGGYVAVSFWEYAYVGKDAFPLKLLAVFLSGFYGIIAGLLSALVPYVLLVALKTFWRLMAYDDEPHPFEAFSLSDMAGIASALHPRTGTLLNVAASAQARAKTPQPTPLVETAVDSEKL